jgi:hypothetical protein
MENKKYLGVREWSYTGDGLFGSQQHNFNLDYRKAMPHVDSTKSKYNIRIDGDLSLKKHYSLIQEYNKSQPWNSHKVDTQLTKNRTKWFNFHDEKELTKSEYLKQGGDRNPSHLTTTSEKSYTANKSSIEQVLYFSNSINEEDINKEDWIKVMSNWSKHMNDKFGRVMINSVVHLKDEFSGHIHTSFSCLKEENGKVVYQNPQITKSGYGSSLQDDFEIVFNETINQDKLNHTYNRGEKKKSYREVGNDHTRSKDYREQLGTLKHIIQSLTEKMKSEASAYEILKEIRSLKEIYKGDEMFDLLNGFQSIFKKINKTEQNQKEQTQYIDEAINYVDDMMTASENEYNNKKDIKKAMKGLYDIIYDNNNIAKDIIKKGGAEDLKVLGIQKEKDRMYPIPNPLMPNGVEMKLTVGKMLTGNRLSF